MELMSDEQISNLTDMLDPGCSSSTDIVIRPGTRDDVLEQDESDKVLKPRYDDP